MVLKTFVKFKCVYFNAQRFSTATGTMNTLQSKKFGLPKRFNEIGSSVWTEYIQLALQYKPLNLGQGFPDFAPPTYVSQGLKDVAVSKNNRVHQYTRLFGHPRLVSVLAKLYSMLFKREVDQHKEVLVTVGASEALYATIAGHVDKGDEIIVIEPFFECYQAMIKINGGAIRFIPLRLDKNKKPGDSISSADYTLDVEELTSLFNKKTKAILLNTPNNPLGKVFTLPELEVIANLCKKWNVMCISDEVYEWLVFKPNQHIRIATLPGMWERTITIGSAGKTFSATGWKVGWALGPANLLRNLQVVHDGIVSSCHTPIQEAVALSFEKEMERLDSEDCYFYSLCRDLQVKRDLMVKTFNDIGMTPIIPEGGYFIIADFSSWEPHIDLSSEKDAWKDFKFTKWLIKNAGVLAIPNSVFYNNDHKKLAENCARYCFVKDNEYLSQVDNALQKRKASL